MDTVSDRHLKVTVMTTEDGRAIRYDSDGRKLCAGIVKHTGQPCMLPAMSKQDVCQHHGGKSSGPKRAARLKLLDLIEPALATLAREMASTTNKPADRIRAAENILDRAGVSRVHTIETDDARALLMMKIEEARAQAEQTVQDMSKELESNEQAGEAAEEAAADRERE